MLMSLPCSTVNAIDRSNKTWSLCKIQMIRPFNYGWQQCLNFAYPFPERLSSCVVCLDGGEMSFKHLRVSRIGPKLIVSKQQHLQAMVRFFRLLQLCVRFVRVNQIFPQASNYTRGRTVHAKKDGHTIALLYSFYFVIGEFEDSETASKNLLVREVHSTK